MPDPHRPLPPERPDPAALLIDAVIQRQQPLAVRLSQQWVHRRGLSSFEAFINGSLLSSCGDEAIRWLRQGLELAQTAVPTNADQRQDAAPALQHLIREALAEAIAPMREANATPTSAKTKPLAPQPEDDPWQLATLEAPLRVIADTQAASGTPAPPPADLASLRAWLTSNAA